MYWLNLHKSSLGPIGIFPVFFLQKPKFYELKIMVQK